MGSRHGLAGRVATLLGLALVALAAAPAVSQASFHLTYGTDEEGLRYVYMLGDESSQPLQINCSGGDMTFDGQVFFLNSLGHNLRCNGADSIAINGAGGDDRIGTEFVSSANGFNPAFTPSSPQAPARAVDLIGGPGKDTLKGGPFGEAFNDTNSSGEQGPDTIRGGGGNDEIWGTEDNDVLFGDGGEDIIYPQGGNDVAHGGADHDAFDDLPFGHGADHFFGDGGADQLFGGGGNDILDGGPGGDYMDGQGGKDLMLGRDGGDGLFGSGGADHLFGHGGNDFLRGGKGKDKLVGGPGKDDVRQ